MGQIPITIVPGVTDLGSHGITEDVNNSLDQVLADNTVLVGSNMERSVLVGDSLDDREDRSEIVDVASVGINSSGKSGRLVAKFLSAL